MPSITDYVNTDYLEAYANLLPDSRPNPIVVYVESDEDIAFWRSIFRPYENEKFVFEIKLPSASTLAKGKLKALERSQDIFDLVTGELGKYLLICVDSDYDYLLQNHYQTPAKQAISNKINDNNFIFQTYTYSIENLKCFSESLHDVCVNTTLQDTPKAKRKIDFDAFLKLYSQTVYELFLWNLLFYSKGEEANFTLTDFCNEIKIAQHPSIANFTPAILKEIGEKVAAKIAVLKMDYPDYATEVNTLAQRLQDLGLEAENAYFFIQGHTIFDNVVLMLLNPLCVYLKRERIAAINAMNVPEIEKTNARKHYDNQVGKVGIACQQMLSKNTAFKNCFLFKKIQSDIENYLTEFAHEN